MKHAFVLVLVLASCGGSSQTNAPAAAKPATVTTVAPAATGSATGSAIELGEIVVFDDTEPGIKIHADGSTEMATRSGRIELKDGKGSSKSLPITWKPGPRILADGTVLVKDRPVAQILETSVKLVGDAPLQAAIAKNTMTVTFTGKKAGEPTPTTETAVFVIADDGAFTAAMRGTEAKKVGRIEGADTEGKRRLVLGLIALTVLHSPGEARVTTTVETGGAMPAPKP